MKPNRPHRCSQCGQVGHRIESCPILRKRAPKAKAKKAALQKSYKKIRRTPTYKKTPYASSSRAPPVLIKTLKQKPFTAYTNLTGKAARRELIRMGLLPKSSPASMTCWKCQETYSIASATPNEFRCWNRNCRCRIRNLDVAWTPVYHWQRGGHEIHKPLLLALYTLGIKVPTDAAQHLIGASYDTTEALMKMLKLALAYAELTRGREVRFPAGGLEFDGTSTNTDRSSSKTKSSYCGRFLVAVHRDTQEFALEPLGDVTVQKGAPPPPESLSDVGPLMDRHITEDNWVSTDSAKAFKAYIKSHLRVRGVFHATVVHKKGEYVKLVSCPLSKLSPLLRQKAALVSSTSARTAKFKAGDQFAEGLFSVVKRNMVRLNLKGVTGKASINFLACAWLKRFPGMEGVALGVKKYQDDMRGHIDPFLAFKDDSWLCPMPEQE